MISYDFHIHSALSPCGDNEMTPCNIVNMCQLMEIDTIAVSDHNTIGNVEAVMSVAQQVGIRVIPAMEVETAEEIHVLTLFPDLASAKTVAKQVYDALPNVDNREDIFGQQVYLDDEDRVLGYEKKLLISPTSLSVDELFESVLSVNGIAIPAHVDRHSYSILTNLGFIPPELPVTCIELSRTTEDVDAFFSARPELAHYAVLRNSDAHRLESLVLPPAQLPCEFENLFDYCRGGVL